MNETQDLEDSIRNAGDDANYSDNTVVRIECVGNHSDKISFLSNEDGCSEHMKLCKDCVDAYWRKLLLRMSLFNR